MRKEPQISAYLVIESDDTQMDFDECTAAIGVVPSYTARSKVASVPGAEWGLGFENKEADSIDVVLDELLMMVAGYEDKIRSYASRKGYAILFICNVTIWANSPLYEISASHIRELAILGAEFRLDIYNYSRWEQKQRES